LNAANGITRGYPLSDGTYIAVRADQPLPEQVTLDIAMKGQADSREDSGRRLPKKFAEFTAAKTATELTGKTICIVTHTIPDPWGIDWNGYAYQANPYVQGTLRATEAEAAKDCIDRTVAKGSALETIEVITLNY
jgi:hypothetical protein